MMVADSFRRNRKITITTSPSVMSMVNCTSLYDSRIVSDRSYRMLKRTEGGISARNSGNRFFTESVTSTVLVPGWRWIARMIARSLPFAV